MTDAKIFDWSENLDLTESGSGTKQQMEEKIEGRKGAVEGLGVGMLTGPGRVGELSRSDWRRGRSFLTARKILVWGWDQTVQEAKGKVKDLDARRRRKMLAWEKDNAAEDVKA